MTPEVKSPVMIYTESTPNPETLKFVTNRMLYKGTADFREESLAKEWSPLATAIFEMPYVKGVYICNNFVTVTKEFNYEWQDIMLKTKEFVKKCVEDGMTVVKDGFAESIEALAAENKEKTYSAEDSEIVQRIIDLIETYVKPAVEMDGGNIEFVAFTNGIVTVRLQGSCSGCPSSTVTLKSGIEGMLQRMVPEVKEVVAEMG
ncbi:MAG: NifU family protein [Saprospiraceae bacterium]|jgi:Fe-S cluster biogenesis protein NfuA|nr:NifU family protein [Saprospiraceae bacterium]